jgi:hypothetical protein
LAVTAFEKTTEDSCVSADRAGDGKGERKAGSGAPPTLVAVMRLSGGGLKDELVWTSRPIGEAGAVVGTPGGLTREASVSPPSDVTTSEMTSENSWGSEDRTGHERGERKASSGGTLPAFVAVK